MLYKTEDDTLQVTVDYYPNDGAQVIVSRWNGDDFTYLYNSRIIAQDLHETVTTALTGSGFDWEYADSLCANWKIFPSDYDCTCDDCTW